MNIFLEKDGDSIQIEKDALPLFFKSRSVVRIKKDKSVDGKIVFLTRFSTIRQAETFMRDDVTLKSLLEKYEEIQFTIESLHKLEVSPVIPYINRHPDVKFYIPTVDRLLKTKDISSIAIPTNIVFVHEDKELTYPANEEEIAELAAAARINSDWMSKQMSKKNKIKRMRVLKPRKKYLSFEAGSRIASLRSRDKSLQYLREQRKKYHSLSNSQVESAELTKEIANLQAKLDKYTNELEKNKKLMSESLTDFNFADVVQESTLKEYEIYNNSLTESMNF